MIVFVFGADASGAWDAQLARVTPVNTRQESVAKRMIEAATSGQPLSVVERGKSLISKRKQS